jgi:hypothetical protein
MLLLRRGRPRPNRLTQSVNGASDGFDFDCGSKLGFGDKLVPQHGAIYQSRLRFGNGIVQSGGERAGQQPRFRAGLVSPKQTGDSDAIRMKGKGGDKFLQPVRKGAVLRRKPIEVLPDGGLLLLCLSTEFGQQRDARWHTLSKRTGWNDVPVFHAATPMLEASRQAPRQLHCEVWICAGILGEWHVGHYARLVILRPFFVRPVHRENLPRPDPRLRPLNRAGHRFV